MEYRELGVTGIRISAVAFGAGPVAGLMTTDSTPRQRETVRAALDAGINWFDTAATYGDGRSESRLGQALNDLGATGAVHLATKVRLEERDLTDIQDAVFTSFTGSLQRLGVERVTLLQLHNAITAQRGDQPTSVRPEDVLGPGGILEAFRRLQDRGLVRQIGLTGLGQTGALRRVVASGHFDTIQVPYNLLHPDAGQTSESRCEKDERLRDVITDCGHERMGVLAIRVFAGGALAGQRPSAHTLRTRFFPLKLYERDQRHTQHLRKMLGAETDLKEVALRFVLTRPEVSAAIIGFGDPAHVRDAQAYLAAGPLPEETLQAILRLRSE